MNYILLTDDERADIARRIDEVMTLVENRALADRISLNWAADRLAQIRDSVSSGTTRIRLSRRRSASHQEVQA